MRVGLTSATLVALLAFLAPSHALAPTGVELNLGSSETEPRFCHGLDCPPFTVEKSGDSYDVRVYPGGLKWTSTVVTGSSFDDAVSTGFMRLFRYIGGENERSEKIAMTAPVRVQVAPGDGPFCDSNFTVSFFVPFEDKDTGKKQKDVPAPTNKHVFQSVDQRDTQVFVVRVYPGGLKWTSTVVTGSSFDDAVSTGFMRLFRYIGGENERSEKIAMTAPVRVQVAPGDGPFCDSNFTVSFFVPFEDKDTGKKQKDVPAPTNKHVFQSVDQRDTQVFVKAFGGYSDEKILQREATALAEALQKDDIEISQKTYVYAGYDSPFRPIDRHNEVWMTEG